jgi:hypothetical protein
MTADGIPWLTDPQRDFLAHLTVITIQPQLKPARSHERIADALGELAERGEVLLRADDNNVWSSSTARSSCMPPVTGWSGRPNGGPPPRATSSSTVEQPAQPLQRAAPMRSSNTENKGIDTAWIEHPIDVHDSGRVGGHKANLHDETSVFVQ